MAPLTAEQRGELEDVRNILTKYEEKLRRSPFGADEQVHRDFARALSMIEGVLEEDSEGQ